VARVAERYFGYRQNDRQRLFLEDGRAFVERAQREGRQYDMVMLDAFDVDYIPPHLLTIEFFQILRSIIAPDGVLVSNSFTTSTMYDRESATYAAVFGAFFNLRAERQDLSANRVIIAPLGPLPGKQALASNAAALADALAPFGIVPASMLPLFSSEPDWDQNAAVLTD
jgi:spermidine synthase